MKEAGEAPSPRELVGCGKGSGDRRRYMSAMDRYSRRGQERERERVVVQPCHETFSLSQSGKIRGILEEHTTCLVRTSCMVRTLSLLKKDFFFYIAQYFSPLPFLYPNEHTKTFVTESYNLIVSSPPIRVLTLSTIRESISDAIADLLSDCITSPHSLFVSRT